MKHFALAKEHLDYFYRHHFIEFEDLLTQAEVENVKHGTLKTIASRLNTSEDQLPSHSLKALYLAGYDTWRESDAVKKIVLRPHFAEIASQLMKAKPLRIGFDQTFLSPATTEEKSDALPPLFKLETTLAQTSCLQGIVCGLILHLSDQVANTPSSELSETLIPIPRRAGSGLFFSPDMPISLDHLLNSPNQHQLLIVFTEDNTFYRLNELDPYTHNYKKLGYVFGDKLRSTTHPVIYRG